MELKLLAVGLYGICVVERRFNRFIVRLMY